MSTVDSVVEKLRHLSSEKQQAVLDYVTALHEQPAMNARQTLDRIRHDIEHRHGELDIVVPLLREDRDN